MKQFLKENSKTLVVLSILNAFLFFYNYIYYGVAKHGHGRFVILYFLAHVIIEAAGVVTYYYCKKRSFTIEKIFVLVFSPLILLHLFVTPLNQVPDESGHIYRAVAISEGGLVAPVNERGEHVLKIDKAANSTLYNWANDHKTYNRAIKNAFSGNSGETTDVNYDNTAGYHPVNYLPQATGIGVGKLLNLPLGFSLYIGRLFAAFVFMALCYFAIKIIPCYKGALFFLAMLPEVLQQGMSFSPDSLLFGLSFFVIALAAKYIYGKDKRVSKTGVFLIYVTTIVLALTKKIIYLPLFSLFFLIPKARYGSGRKKYAVLFSALIIAVSISLAWSMGQDALSASTSNMEALVRNPFRFLTIAIGSMLGLNASSLVAGSVGGKLGYNTVDALAGIYIYIAVILFALFVAGLKEKITQKMIEKAIFIAIPIVITGLLYVGAYTQWDFNDADGAVIWGIQGRYLIPFFGLVPFICHGATKKARSEIVRFDTVVLFGVFMNACIIGCKFLYNI